MDIGIVIGLGVAVMLLALVIQRARRREAPEVVTAERSEVDAWVEEAIARELGKRIALGEGPLLEALRGDPSPDAVTAMEDAVRNVKLTYEKLPVTMGAPPGEPGSAPIPP